MIELIVEGINQEIGPGDIVGAFTNEAQIKGNDIGKITIRRGKALVEISENTAHKVVKIMDGNQVGGVEVKVNPKNPEDLMDKKLSSYLKKYRSLVELERNEEMERHLREIKYLTGKQRENKGRALLNMKGRDQGEGFAGKYLIKFLKEKPGLELPEIEISVGDLVLLSQNNPLQKNNPTGTVVEKTSYSLTVVFDQKPPSFLYGKSLRIDLYVNDITYQRMLTALEKLGQAEGRLKEIQQILLGNRTPEFGELSETEIQLEFLNKTQKEAVQKAIAARDVFLIHGPPGTGKTMTCIELIIQAARRNKTILATADSNTAVDNLVERLVLQKVNVVRAGHPARVTPVLREHTLDYLLMEQPKYQQAEELRKEAGKLLDQQDKLTHPSGRWRRGMDNNQIISLAESNRSSRGVPVNKIKQMADWLKIQEEIDELFRHINELEEQAVEQILAGADVICSTNSTAGSDLLANYYFDLVVVDEATQSTEPAALIPLIKGNKVVMAGDHQQLPPTILSAEAAKQGLSVSLFERLYNLFGDQLRGLLKIQYRMHKLIMEYSNQQFYDGELLASHGAARQKLTELGVSLPQGNSPAEKAFRISPLAFLDTQNLYAAEKSRGDSYSYENPLEVDLVGDCLTVAARIGLKNKDIAVISPYKDQVDLIKHRFGRSDLEIDTVDGFQGREKEIVIFSCVRSNQEGNIGFLRDLRRLNVAITRAKKRLIMIGDAQTISSHPAFVSLIKLIKDRGFYYLL